MQADAVDKKRKLRTLFFSTLELSAFTFGGGFVIIPLLRKKFLDQLHWIEEQEMLDLVAIAQSSPGAIAVNASILVGYHVAGIPGALLSVIGTVLPPLVIISVISLFYAAFRSNAYVNMAMNGMLAGVAAVICDVVLTMGTPLFRAKKPLPLLVLIGSFLAVYALDMSIMLVILVCAGIGALEMLWKKKQQGKEAK